MNTTNYDEITETGEALAHAAFERGDRLTEYELRALGQWSMFGSDGYPIRKLGRHWSIDHPAAAGTSLYNTKRDATRAWEILIAKWIRLKGLEAQARAMGVMR